jgi:SAM-dependent methyltransferase
MTGEPIDKYDLYNRAAQHPAADAVFFRELYRQVRGHAPRILLEDFCGTFPLCCEWVKLGPAYAAHGRDLSREAVKYGSSHYLAKLTDEQRSRVTIETRDVLAPGRPASDVVAAMNFSYFVFKKRETLARYFRSCFKSLREDGILLVDAFGGPGVHRPNAEKTSLPGFDYYWQQYGFDPVSHEARCAMHFRPAGRRKFKDAFTYDWRLWGLAETRDLMAEAGFRRTRVYWGGDEHGQGGGKFALDERGGRDKVWLALIVAEK